MAKLQLMPLRIDDCDGCPLFRTGQLSPDMPTSGKGKLGVMLVGMCPGAIEAQQGTQFVGPAGQLLRTIIKSLSLDLDEDFWKTNAIRCRPLSKKKVQGRSQGREPTTAEINACNTKLFKSIHKRKPKIVIPLGKHALIALIGKYVNDITISKFRGTFIPIPEHNFYLAPALHPSFVLRQDDDYSYETLHRDLKETFSLLEYIPDGHTIEPLDIRKPIHLITDFVTFSSLMEKIHREKPVSAFDFETSSKKPQNLRSRIWSMSICFNGKSYSFPVQYPAVQGVYPKSAAETMWGTKYLPQVIDKIKRYLQDSACKKIVQNESFERIWSYFVLDSPVNSLRWCTMNSQHILDARKGFCGLKLQAFIRWGIHHYDEEINYYIKSKEESGANALNQLHRAPLESLLLYGGVDSFLTEKLAQAQLEVFNLPGNEPLHNARRLFHETAIAFTNCQKTGIHIDVPHYQKIRSRLTNEITKNIQIIQTSAEVKQFEDTEQRGFNLNSPVDLRVLLFDILKEKSKKKTTTGLDSVDKDVLTDLKTPIGKRIIKIREFKKLRDTYIAQYLREEVDGRVYPFLHTHTARSGRSCVAKGTLVLVVKDFEEHPDGIPIEDVRKGDLVYCFDNKLNPAIRKVKWAGKTGHREIVRLHFHWHTKDRGHLDITPEHKVRLINGEYVPACLLRDDFRSSSTHKKTPRCRVLSCLRREDKLLFTGHLKSHKGILEHRFLYKNLIGSLADHEIIHHKNERHLDHTPKNMEKMVLPEHSRLHSVGKPVSNKTKIKCSINAKAAWASGACDHVPEMTSLCLSRFEVLRALAKAKGRPVLCPYDFDIFKKYCKLHDINIETIRARYDRNNNYISKNRLMAAMDKGPNCLLKTFGFNYYKTRRVYSYYNRTPKRIWRNQFGEGLVGNHAITKVEWLNKSADVYDVEVEDFPNFFANGICVHNSASDPNLQNTPERNESAKKLIKRGIKPIPGNKIAEVDFSGIEINMLACETKDKALLKYLWTPTSDMHFDQGKKLFILDNDGMNKALRYNAKSDFVFLEVYGGKAAASAKYLWFDSIDIKAGKNSDGPKLRKHLAQQGIRHLDDFKEHVREVETEFWKEFPGIRRWQKGQGEFYLKHGYVETHFGFRRSGYLKWEVILNTQTQSTAAHLLWWCFNKVDRIRIKEKWKTKLLGQIHDSILPDIHPAEEQHVMETIYRVMTIETVKAFPWIIVPIDIEIEIAEIDQSWYDINAVPKEYYKTLASKEEVAATRSILKSRVMNLGRQ